MSLNNVHIGTSGWSYDHWEDIVYPKGSPSRDRLKCFIKQFNTVEVNSSFYHWPKESTFDHWREQLPEGFTMTIKAPRGLTHCGRLANAASWVSRIRTSMAKLGDRKGVLLVQLPPTMEIDMEALDSFLTLYSPWQRLAIELRHPTWQSTEVFDLLEVHKAAYCVMSGARLPCLLKATTDFVYVRLHGPDKEYMYGGSYSSEDLQWWADRIREWTSQGREVFVYFNNDGGGNAVRNAEGLRCLLALTAEQGQPL